MERVNCIYYPTIAFYAILDPVFIPLLTFEEPIGFEWEFHKPITYAPSHCRFIL